MKWSELIKEKNIKVGDKVVINYLGSCIVGICEGEPALVQDIGLLGWNGDYVAKVLIRAEDGKPHFQLLTQVNKLTPNTQ